MLEFRYTHPRTGADMEIRQAVRVPRDLPFALRIGEHVTLVCCVGSDRPGRSSPGDAGRGQV